MNPANLPVVNQGYWEAYKNSILREDCSIQSLAAKASCVVFPIFLVLAALFALMDNFFTAPQEPGAKQVEIDPIPAHLKPQVPIRIELQGARQYDMEGDIPAACTFHAFEAMRKISIDFWPLFRCFTENRGDLLTRSQKEILIEGLANYETALKTKPDLVQGADLENMREFIPDGIQMGPTANGVFIPCEANAELPQIADHLFGGDFEAAKVVWMKNPNDESFALIGRGNRVILFDSHYNEIRMLFTKEQVVAALQRKLGLDPQMNLFDYALGTA